MTTVTITGFGTFEIPNERVNEVINLLRTLQATKVKPVTETQGTWGGNVLLNG